MYRVLVIPNETEPAVSLWTSDTKEQVVPNLFGMPCYTAIVQLYQASRFGRGSHGFRGERRRSVVSQDITKPYGIMFRSTPLTPATRRLAMTSPLTSLKIPFPPLA